MSNWQLSLINSTSLNNFSWINCLYWYLNSANFDLSIDLCSILINGISAYIVPVHFFTKPPGSLSRSKYLIVFLCCFICFNNLHKLQKPSSAYFCLNKSEAIPPYCFLCLIYSVHIRSTYSSLSIFNSRIIASMKPFLN